MTSRRSTDYGALSKRAVRGRPIEYSEHFMRSVFACRGYINKGIVGSRDTLAKILHIVDKWNNFNLHPINFFVILRLLIPV